MLRDLLDCEFAFGICHPVAGGAAAATAAAAGGGGGVGAGSDGAGAAAAAAGGAAAASGGAASAATGASVGAEGADLETGTAQERTASVSMTCAEQPDFINTRWKILHSTLPFREGHLLTKSDWDHDHAEAGAGFYY